MRPNNGAVDNQVLHIRVIGKVGMHLRPDAMVAPAGEPFIDGVPGTVFTRQEAPLGPGSGYPENALEKTATLARLTDIGARMPAQKGEYFGPLRI